MKDFSTYISERAHPEQLMLRKSYTKKAEQLALLIKESKERYEVKKHIRRND